MSIIGITGAVVACAATISPSPTLIDQAKHMGYQACVQEDSVGPCYWDATKRGNGKGTSFVVTDDNEVFYDYSL